VGARSRFEQAATKEETTQATITTTTEEGNWSVRTWEFAPGTSALAQDPRAPGRSPATQGRQSAGETTPEVAGSIPAGGPLPGLLRYTEEEHGPRTEETRAEAKGASLASGAVKGEGKSEGSWSTRLGPSFMSWIGIVAAVALAGFISAKTGWPPFLLPLWKLLRLA
jgi:hypothetical protein